MTIARAADAAIAASALVVGVWAQQPTFKRTVLQQGDISVPGHEAVTAVAEFQPGAASGRHSHPGDEIGNGLVQHCYFPLPKWLMLRGVGQSWEWLTEVTPFESWRYDAVGKPLWSRATGWTRFIDLVDGRTRVTVVEE